MQPLGINLNIKGAICLLVLDALYMEKMVMNIRSWMTKPEDAALMRPPKGVHDDQKGTEDICVLIVEGFLLYNYK